MTQQEIIELAKQSDLGFLLGDSWLMHHEIEYFAKLVADKEREACAKETKEIKDLLTLIAGIVRDTHLHGSEMQRLLDKEKAIRARGQA